MPSGPARVEERDDLVLQEAEQRLGVVLVLRVRIARRADDRPPVGPVVGLFPPAVGDAEVESAVQHHLHAAGAARLERRARQVEPQVDAGDDRRRDVQVVVLQEHARGGRSAARRESGKCGSASACPPDPADAPCRRRRAESGSHCRRAGGRRARESGPAGRAACTRRRGARSRWSACSGRRRAPPPRRTPAARRATDGRGSSARGRDRPARGAACSAPPRARRRESGRCPPRAPGRRARPRQSGPRWRSSRSLHRRRPSSVVVCTPLVTWAIGTSAAARPGYSGRHMCARHLAVAPRHADGGATAAQRQRRDAHRVRFVARVDTADSRRTPCAGCRACRRSRPAPARARRRCSLRCPPRPACGW